MYFLSAAQLLSIWERGQSFSPVLRGLALLSAALPDWPAEELASLSIGRRDVLLLRLRENTFGPQLSSLVSCPNCAEKLELPFQAGTLYSPAAWQEPSGESGAFTVEAPGWQVSFRLPTSLDLLEVVSPTGESADAESIRQMLLERCLLTVWREGQPLEPPLSAGLPPQAAAAVMEKMAAEDPQAEVALDLTCPACGHRWAAGFDILSFFWAEIQAWAGRILQEVHILALAYGWREADILAMSSQRRQAYLEMLSG